MGKIKVLSKELINLIAAGEVVERPASVVKELMENSIDAGSDTITVSIEEAGNKLIRIKDNGSGMDKDDSILALTQHATSKISHKNDLNNINTLGFRGEALASIAEVSGETIIETSSEKASAVKVTYKQKNISLSSSNKSERGTIIEIKNLFENIPARKKFLKGANTELKNIISTFIQIALPYPNIHFELYHNDKLLYRLTKVNEIKQRIYEIWGEKTANNLYINSADLSGMKIDGLLGNVSLGKEKQNLQFIYINNRFIKSSLISAAVNKGYEGFLHKNLKPPYFIFITLNPSKVDINIHPRKLEAKFENEQEIFLNIMRFSRSTLESSTKSEMMSSFSEGQNESLKPNFISDRSSSPRSSSLKVKSKVTDAINFTAELYQGLKSFNNEPMQEDYIPNKVFQIFNTYIVCERGDKLLMVDQHAAAEKINFEKLIKQYKSHSKTKPLLVPEIIELSSNAEKNEILERKEELEKIGFVIDDFGGKTIQVSEIPENLIKTNYINLINDLIHNENLGIDTSEETLSAHDVSKEIYLSIATLACHGSIRAGQGLNEIEMKNIISDLLKLENPYNCPHGRPTMWEISKYEIEKNFNRNI